MRSQIVHNTNLIFRCILFLTFVGHGLVNLGFSPSVSLHMNLVSAVFPESVDAKKALYFFAAIDFTLALLVLSKVLPKLVIRLAIAYVLSIAIAAWSFYFKIENSVFGIAEIMRRLPWVFFLLYLYFDQVHYVSRFRYLRIGLSFAFLAHGISSLGFLGINKGHIELASQIVPEDYVRDFGDGATDTTTNPSTSHAYRSKKATKSGFFRLHVNSISFFGLI